MTVIDSGKSLSPLTTPFATDQGIWDLVVDCFHVLDTGSRRRWLVHYEQQRLQAGGQIVAAKIELDDKEFLHKFKDTITWVQLSNSLS